MRVCIRLIVTHCPWYMCMSMEMLKSTYSFVRLFSAICILIVSKQGPRLKRFIFENSF